MDLEDMIALTQYPIVALSIVAEELNLTFEEYKDYVVDNESSREVKRRIWGLIELLMALAVHLESIRQEFKKEV